MLAEGKAPQGTHACLRLSLQTCGWMSRVTALACMCCQQRTNPAAKAKPDGQEGEQDEPTQDDQPLVGLAKLAADIVVNPLFYVVAGESSMQPYACAHVV